MGAKILSKSEIIDKVKNGDIKISYYCTKPGSGKGDFQAVFDPIKSDEEQNDAWKLFIASFDPDCFYLTVGPYALVEHRSFWRYLFEFFPRFGRRFLQRKGQDIYNIFESSPIVFYPGENIIIGTNEYIAVNNKIGASLYAAVRNTDVGLPHISTTIDPGWKGRLQIGLVNPTRTKKEFHFMEQICKVRFHEYDQVCGMVESKAHSVSWQEIESDTSKLFFPRRKESESRMLITNLYNFNWNIILAIVCGGWFLNDKYHDFKDFYDDNINQQNHKIELIEKELNIKKVETQTELNREAVSRLTPLKQAEPTQRHITFNRIIGQRKSHFTIGFDREYKEKPSVFIMTDNDRVRYNITLPKASGSNSTYQSAEISAWLRRGTGPEQQDINFDLFIVD